MATNFTGKITPDGEFQPEANRYILYGCLGCPFSQRAHIALSVKGLQGVIDICNVHWKLETEGWRFCTPNEYPGATPDPVNNFGRLREAYVLTDPEFAGKVTVPVLFDKKTNKIVNNESDQILRIFSNDFNNFAKHPEIDLYPEELRTQIHELNKVVAEGANFGVYKAGFASNQEDYAGAARLVHQTLKDMEAILAKDGRKYLFGDQLAETDIRLFTTLIRFDPIYYNFYNCNLSRVQDFPLLSAWLKRVFDFPGVKETVNMEHSKKLYYLSPAGEAKNPNHIIPLYNGPLIPSD